MAKTTKGRVAVPKNVPGALALAAKVYKKHIDDGTSSPLNELEDYKWTNIGPNVILAQAKHDEAERLKEQMEQAYRDRDAYLPDIVGITNASKAMLKSKFAKNPKRLGDWGYEVDDTPRAKKAAKAVA